MSKKPTDISATPKTVKSARTDSGDGSAYNGKLDDVGGAKSKPAKSDKPVKSEKPLVSSRTIPMQGNRPAQVGRHSQRNAPQSINRQNSKQNIFSDTENDDDYDDENDTEHQKHKKLQDFAGSAFSQNSDGDTKNSDDGDDNLNFYKKIEQKTDENHQSYNMDINQHLGNGDHRNQHAITFLQDFLDNTAPSHTQKQQLHLLLTQMFQQCIDGMRHFPPTTRQHDGFGRSANICKHALSALSRDDIMGAKKMLEFITPKRK